jgi:hypothetical protein
MAAEQPITGQTRTRRVGVVVEELQGDVAPHLHVKLRQVKVDHRVAGVELVHFILRFVLVEHGVLLVDVPVLLACQDKE